MIEIGPESDSYMTYDEAVMYCFALGSGWRLPTFEEQRLDYHAQCHSWYLNDALRFETDEYWSVTPVRDLTDD